MKKQMLLLFALIIACTVHAQPGGHVGVRGPRFTGAMGKLFAANPTFSAAIESQMTTPQGQTMTVPGQIAFDAGNSRLDMDLNGATGSQMTPAALAHMKMMGMDKSTTITRLDKKTSYAVFPGLSAYVEQPISDPDAAKPDSAFKTDVTELSKETVDGHPCVKNKVVVTDDQGAKHESTVWNATDLKNFPIKVETTEQGYALTMSFKDVKFAKPDASLFNPPADYKKYDNVQALMQQEMMKRMGSMKMPPGHP
jgi:hypothetical protein